MNAPVLLGFYELGNAIGGFSAVALSIMFVLIWIIVMFKYLDTKDLKG